MEPTEEYTRMEAASQLVDDYAVLRAEAESQVRTLAKMISGTRADLDDVMERTPPDSEREAALVSALVRMQDLRAVWEGRLAVYDRSVRVVERRLGRLAEPT